ncbi:MAG: twin-arginine translocase TatA/TatE family subunit [Dehalococcoidia bacterium]
MNILGIGNMELVVILLVALLVLGPVRMLDMARSLGRFWGEAQRTIRYAIDAATVEDEQQKKPEGAPSVPREPVQEPEDAVLRPPRYKTGQDNDRRPADDPPPPPEAGANGHAPGPARDTLPPDPLTNEDEHQRG